MDSVIVTVKSTDCKHKFDVELPIDLPANILIDRIIKLINSVDCCFAGLDNKYQLKIQNLGRTLEDDETLEEAGVWDGSILKIIKDNKEKKLNRE